MKPAKPRFRARRSSTSLVSSILLVLALVAVPSASEAQVPADLQLTPVISSNSTAVAVRHAGDGSGRLFVVEKAGRIWIWDGSDGMNTLATPFLDIRDNSGGPVNDTGGFGERGLLGLAFHPDYATNGFFYVNYTRGSEPGDTVVERYSVSAGDPNVADDTSGQSVIEIDQDFGNHNGGNILFSPADGYLYIGMGDGGSGNDPNNRSQTLTELLGKMLRIDVDGDDFPGDAARNYAIPADNPFVGVLGEDEIWAVGLRNPWRFSFDRSTNDLIIGDVGQLTREEIDFQPAASSGGENYGWSCKEGFLMPNFNPCLAGTLTDPILDYSHSGGNCSVTGGYRYRGSIGGFVGVYVYADFCTGQVHFATEDTPGNWSTSLWMDTSISPTSFGEDEDGELYMVDSGGTVYRFESPSSSGTIFTDGFESGDTTAWTSTVGGP